MNDLRPTKFSDIVGQEDVIKSLEVSILSANIRHDSLPHTLIESQPGLGKSTVCGAIANELNVEMRTILGGNIKSFNDIYPVLCEMGYREVLFIDEVHQINKKMAESMYTVLEDFRADIIKENQIESTKLSKFTIIGATTESGAMPKPLRERFKLRFILEPYSIDEIEGLIENNIKKLKVNISRRGIRYLARASRGVPRNANRLLEWLRDYQIANFMEGLQIADVETALGYHKIDSEGLTENDRIYLEFVKDQGKPVGVVTIAASTGIDRETILNVIEPHLLSTNRIKKTQKGRIIK
jgi:Holliday junction DNA helicase RuvB